MARSADKLRATPVGTDGLPPLEEDEEVLETFEEIELAIGQRSRGFGSLVVTSLRVVWLPAAGTDQGALAAAFRDIGMHGLVRPESGKGACVYLQLADDDDVLEVEEDDEDDGGDDQDEDESTLEVFLRVADESRLDQVYAALSRGAELNPDEYSDDDDADGGAFFDRDSVLAGATRALGLDDSRFQDDEDEEA